MKSPFSELVEIMERLRAPGGCPWDKEQTHQSLIPYLREESFEVIEAILKEDDSHFCEELGDLILQVVFHAKIAKDRKAFDINDVLKSINEKLVRRHPHVFETHHVQTESLDDQWEKIKQSEKSSAEPKKPSRFQSISKLLDPWLLAERIQLLAAEDHFDWDSSSQVIDKIKEELEEFQEAQKNESVSRQKEELGDLLFSVINLCRFMEWNPSELLKETNQKFMARYDKMVASAKKDHPQTKFRKLPIETKEKYWSPEADL